ncbi:MAG: DUF6404 family protein [Pseudomonadota bacterium]
MKFEEKIEIFRSHMKAKGAALSILDPIGFRMARRFGIEILPPVFRSMWSNALLMFVCTFVPMATLVLVWPLFYTAVSVEALYLLFIPMVAKVAGIFSLIMSVIWWWHKNSLGIQNWKEYKFDNS